jgi:hypothetical protein
MSVELMKTIKEKVAALAEELKAAIKPAIKEQTDAIFAADANVKSVNWTQYAPYFNDGDACEFSVREPWVRFDDEDTPEEDVDEDAEWENTAGSFDNEALNNALQALSELIQSEEIEGAMKQAFGADSIITIDRAGNVTVDEYDHD